MVAFITSQISPAPLASDVVITDTDGDFPRTGLRASSVIRSHRLMTVTAGLIRRELGELSPRLMQDVDSKLKALFGLT